MENAGDGNQKLRDDHRTLLQQTVQESWRSYDKTVLTLSGGALGISFAFVKDVIGDNPISQSWLLLLGWSCLALSMGVVLLSFFAAGKANERAVVQLDGDKDEATGGTWNKTTNVCNPLGGILFVVGVLFVILCISINLNRGGTLADEPKKPEPAPLEEGRAVQKQPPATVPMPQPEPSANRK